MVSAEQYDALSSASSRFISEETFGVPEIEDVMSTVFGANRSGKEAESWRKYWNELNVYEEELRTNGNMGDMPMVCAHLWLFQ